MRYIKKYFKKSAFFMAALFLVTAIFSSNVMAANIPSEGYDDFSWLQSAHPDNVREVYIKPVEGAPRHVYSVGYNVSSQQDSVWNFDIKINGSVFKSIEENKGRPCYIAEYRPDSEGVDLPPVRNWNSFFGYGLMQGELAPEFQYTDSSQTATYGGDMAMDGWTKPSLIRKSTDGFAWNPYHYLLSNSGPVYNQLSQQVKLADPYSIGDIWVYSWINYYAIHLYTTDYADLDYGLLPGSLEGSSRVYTGLQEVPKISIADPLISLEQKVFFDEARTEDADGKIRLPKQKLYYRFTVENPGEVGYGGQLVLNKDMIITKISNLSDITSAVSGEISVKAGDAIQLGMMDAEDVVLIEGYQITDATGDIQVDSVASSVRKFTKYEALEPEIVNMPTGNYTWSNVTAAHKFYENEAAEFILEAVSTTNVGVEANDKNLPDPDPNPNPGTPDPTPGTPDPDPNPNTDITENTPPSSNPKTGIDSNPVMYGVILFSAGISLLLIKRKKRYNH